MCLYRYVTKCEAEVGIVVIVIIVIALEISSFPLVANVGA